MGSLSRTVQWPTWCHYWSTACQRLPTLASLGNGRHLSRNAFLTMPFRRWSRRRGSRARPWNRPLLGIWGIGEFLAYGGRLVICWLSSGNRLLVKICRLCSTGLWFKSFFEGSESAAIARANFVWTILSFYLAESISQPKSKTPFSYQNLDCWVWFYR